MENRSEAAIMAEDQRQKEMIMSKRKTPPTLKWPEEKTFAAPPGSIAFVDAPLKVRRVSDKDWLAMGINILSAVILWIVLSVVLSFVSTSNVITAGIPSAIVVGLIIVFTDRLWTNVSSRSAGIYLDSLFPGKIIVLLQGFHFLTWSSIKQEEEVSFQKHETINSTKECGSEIRFPSQDGYELFADVVTLYSRRDSEEAMSKSLRFKTEEITIWTSAVLASRLSDLGGQNSYESLLFYKGEVIAWVANIFGGQDNISPFENRLGIEIKNPALRALDLTDESKKTFGTRAKIDVVNEGIKKLRKHGVSPDEAAITAQTIEGASTRVIHTYQGVPQGAKVVALGDTGMAIASKGK